MFDACILSGKDPPAHRFAKQLWADDSYADERTRDDVIPMTFITPWERACDTYTGLTFSVSKFLLPIFDVMSDTGAAHAHACRALACTCPRNSTEAFTALPHMRAHATPSNAQSNARSSKTLKA
eukprot:9491619-Pyramimonas_sp.AAC.1